MLERLFHRSSFLIFASVALIATSTIGQTTEFHGQASGWVVGSSQVSTIADGGLRYLPDFIAGQNVADDVSANVELSLNTIGSAMIATNEHPSFDDNLKLYRAWFRIGTDRFETRIGLQKISFGPAMLFRPLMWFDRIDPRDPLQLTDGVYGLLSRYTFQDNTNIWLWGLYGNNDTKGWELAPTEKGTVEFGGRMQSSLWDGELGVTYHHRRADIQQMTALIPSTTYSNSPEDRVGLDGKWDVGIGVWFEASVSRFDIDLPQLSVQRLWTVGADYTIGVGNGLYVAVEHFRMERPTEIFASSTGTGFSGLSMSYPIGILDQVSGIIYRDWNNERWYRIVTWQRKYDNWSFYLMGFWDPETIQIYPGQGGTNSFAGKGVQLMAVFNH